MTREEKIIENAYMYESVTRDEFRGTVESFKAGARWSDTHPQSQWVPIDGKHPLPDVEELVLLYYPIFDGLIEIDKRTNLVGKRKENGSYDSVDEYGFKVIAETFRADCLGYHTVRPTYYMQIQNPLK